MRTDVKDHFFYILVHANTNSLGQEHCFHSLLQHSLSDLNPLNLVRLLKLLNCAKTRRRSLHVCVTWIGLITIFKAKHKLCSKNVQMSYLLISTSSNLLQHYNFSFIHLSMTFHVKMGERWWHLKPPILPPMLLSRRLQ